MGAKATFYSYGDRTVMPLTRPKNLTTSLVTSALPSGSVLQVVQGFSGSKTVTNTSANGNAIECPATVSITPSSTSNKILILFHATWQFGNNNDTAFWLLRNGTAVGTATRTGENVAAFAMETSLAFQDYHPRHISFNYLDEPSSTSAITYSVKGIGIQGAKQTNDWANPTGAASQNEEMTWGGSQNTSSSESNIGNMVIIAQEIKG